MDGSVLAQEDNFGFGVTSSARLSSRPTPTPTSLTLKSLEETEGFDWE